MPTIFQLQLVTENSEYATVTALDFLPGTQQLILGYIDGTIGIWNVETGKQERTVMNHKLQIGNLAVTHDGTTFVSIDIEGGIKVWNVDSHALVEEWTRMLGCVEVAISLVDDRLIAFGDGKSILRHLYGGQEIKHSFKFRGTVVHSMCFSPDGHKLACAVDGFLHVIDIEGGKRIIGPLRPPSDFFSWTVPLLWSRNGSKLFSAWSNGDIYCFNPDTGELIGQPWKGHTTSVQCLFLSLDGSKLANVGMVRFSPSGEFMALVGLDNKLYLWQVSRPGPVESQAIAIKYASALPLKNFHPYRLKQVLTIPLLHRKWDDGPSRSIQLVPGHLTPHHHHETMTPTAFHKQAGVAKQTCHHTILRRGVNRQMSRLSVETPPPLDLTSHIVKISNRYSVGGGFGDPTIQVQVAVKAFRFKFTLAGDADNESLKMLRRELGIWRRLNHTNIVPFLGIAYGFGMDGAMSLVSLWMSNDTLQNCLEVHDDKLGALLDIANGLQYLHSLSIVHGDLNCNNVLLDADYTVRLGDFGHASLVGNIPEALSYLWRSTTRPGALRWTAPEQIDFENTFSRTTKSDIYSFGCVLSGKQPWSEVREDAAVVLHIAKGYKPGWPASRPVDDLHWTLMERCWSSIEERPAAKATIIFIQQFLSSYPPFQPLHDIMLTSDDSSLTEPSFGEAPTDASYTNVGTLDRENENRITSLPGPSGLVRFRQSTDSSNVSPRPVMAESHLESPQASKRQRDAGTLLCFCGVRSPWEFTGHAAHASRISPD
ncbi:kinase-like domain-containing protein [Boletus coccyginus]|nr:kinase-like domain-containing protein [Boletus coccyginus]